MAQCQSWHSYNGRLRIFDCGIDHSSLGWRMAKAVDRIAVHFVIYYLGLWCAWILGRFHQNFQETQHGFKLFTKLIGQIIGGIVFYLVFYQKAMRMF